MNRTISRAARIGLSVLGVIALAATVSTGAAVTRPTAAGYTDVANAALDTYLKPANYTAVSTQFTATSAAISDGWVWVWGYKNFGMSGNGQQNVTDTKPTPVYGLSSVVKVVGASDLGEDYGTFGALTADGSVYTWGSNKLGRLGIGTTSGSGDFRATPQKVTIPNGERVIDIGSMRATMAVLTDVGNVYTWGSGQYGQAGNGSTVEGNGPKSPHLVMSGVHSLHVGQRVSWAITTQNKVMWWGRSFTGEAGNGSGGTVNNPTPIEAPALSAFATNCTGAPVAEYGGADACGVVAITSTRQAGALLTRDGVVHTFGNNADAQIGRPSTAASRLVPLPVSIADPVTHLSAGNYHVTALTTAKQVWGWGDNAEWAATGNIRADGSTGQGQTDAATPFKLPLTDIVAIGGSRDTSYATRSDSVLFGWGDGRDGAIYGSEARFRTFTALKLPGIRV